MKNSLLHVIFATILILFVSGVVAQEWSGPKFDARLGDPYSQNWTASDCKHVQYDTSGAVIDNGAEQIQPFGCYDGNPVLSPEFMSLQKAYGIDILHVDYRIYSLPTWQTLTGCEDLNTYNSQMKTEARADHNYRQSFTAPFDDADDEWEGYTIVWMARAEDLPGNIGMRVKAFAGANAGESVPTKILSGFEARYGCVDPDNDIFGPDNLVIRSGPDPATGHDYVNAFSAEDGSEKWHIYRIAVEVGATPAESFSRIYVDENTEPVITTSAAKDDDGKNMIWWGVGGWNMPKVASMAFVLSTTEGAYGPLERPLPAEYTGIFNKARENWVSSIKYDIQKEEGALPQKFALDQNYPNPFNPTTSIRYHLKKATRVLVSIFNINGQFITKLVNEKQKAGTYKVEWDGRDLYGNQMASGIYFYMLKTSEFSETRKMTLIK
jgi:hypothetical protein